MRHNLSSLKSIRKIGFACPGQRSDTLLNSVRDPMISQTCHRFALGFSVLLTLLGLPLAGYTQQILVPTNTLWKYYSQPVELPEDWKTPDYPDSDWATGLTSLGFGKPVTTVIDGGPSTARHRTVYFRIEFEVSDPAAFASIGVFYRRDDGISINLNGQEGLRDGIAGNLGDLIPFTQLAANAADNGATWFTNRLQNVQLVAGRNVLAVEVHQSSDGSSDLVFDLGLIGFTAPVPPSVGFTSPVNGLALPTKTLILSATASDPDDGLAKVEFFDGETSLAVFDVPPFRYVWSEVPPGPHALTARATDVGGLITTSAVVNVTLQTALLPLGSLWTYFDGGSLPAEDWRDPFFDDSGWNSGYAELGYGDGDEATVVGYGSDANNKYITTYFRSSFDVADPATIQSLVVSLRRDDGAVVYLNGNEAFRSGFAEDTEVLYETLARDTAGEGGEIALFSKQVAPSLLVAGRNVVAVEIHQAAITSSDLSFDLLLRANVPAAPTSISITNPPASQYLLDPSDVTFGIDAVDADSSIVSVELLEDNTVVGQDLIFPYTITVTGLPAGTHTFVARATDENGVTADSQPLVLRVLPQPIITSLVSTGAVWRYLDTGSDENTAWIAPGFDDSAWPEGAAELGFGDSRETTALTPGAITYYFRHHFQFEGPNTATNLLIRVRRDDGVALYLNGEPAGRSNLPEGELLFNTLAGADTDPETDFRLIWVPASLLRIGENVLAAEVHQNSAASSDVSFDLSLDAYAAPGTRPTLTLEANGAAGYRLVWSDPGYVLESSTTIDGGAWSVVVGAASPYSIPTLAGNQFFRLRQP